MQRWVGRPLLGAGPARRWAAIVLAWCAAIVVVLGVMFRHQTTADGFDRLIDEPIVSWLGPHHTLLGWMEYPGTQVPAVVISLAIAVARPRQRRLNRAALARAAILVAARIADRFLKPLFARTHHRGVAHP